MLKLKNEIMQVITTVNGEEIATTGGKGVVRIQGIPDD